jgi:hypothetical protein
VLDSAIYHRAMQTQIALLTCPKLQLIHPHAQVEWYAGGYADGQEYAGVWPTQQENQMSGEKQSLWWRDNLDAAFRYIFLAREYFVQLASGHVVMRIPTSSLEATTRQWRFQAVCSNFGYNTLLSFVKSSLSAVQPDVLQLVYLLMTKSFAVATDYAHGRRAAQRFSAAEMAKAILQRVKVSAASVSACCCAAGEHSELWLKTD